MSEREAIRHGYVTVVVPAEMNFPGHRKELARLVVALDEFINSVVTGKTEPWR